MKLLLHILFCFTLLNCNSQDHKQSKSKVDNQWIVEDLIKKWENNKSYTIKILEAMPAEDYNFVPVKDMRSFKEQASHIGNGFGNKIGKISPFKFEKVDDSTKESIINSYTIIFDEVITNLKSMKNQSLNKETSMWYGSSSYLRLFNLADNHLAHHRGQMVVYLRLKGIKPPSYIGW